MNKNIEEKTRRTRAPKRWVVCYKRKPEDTTSHMYVATASDEDAAWDITKKKLKLEDTAVVVYSRCTT